jgi:hypothetical protein
MHGHEHSRQQPALRIGHHAAKRQGGIGWIDGHVIEIKRAQRCVRRAIRQDHLQAGLVAIKQRHIATGLRGAQHLIGRTIEMHVQAVDLIDRREQGRLALAHQSALGDVLLAGATGDRRGHGGVPQIDARGLDIRLGLLYLRSGGAFRGIVVVHVGTGDQSTGQQVAGALRIDGGVDGGGLRLGQRGQGRIQRCLVRLRVDREQHLAGAHLRTLAVQALEQDARHPRPHIRRADRRHPADQIAGQRHGLRPGTDDTDLRDLGSRSGGRRGAAAGQRASQCQGEGKDKDGQRCG